MIMRRLLKSIGKTALYGFAIIGVVFVSLFGYAMVKQHAKDQQFIRDNLLPIARHVEELRHKTGRLPTDEEFGAWSEATYENKMIVYYQHRPDFCRTWGKEGEAFLIGMWRGEWVQYYCSWDGKDFKGE